MTSDDNRELEYAIAEITEIAEGFGLDFYPMRYEICPADIIYTFGAYGMPTRFSHWSFGKTFHRMKMQYDFGLSKIYELVINSNPCYAFLLEGNSLIQNKLIVAHVLAHCDFFKNNARFSTSNRNMVESMSATAERVSQYEMEYGTQAVESFIDAVLGIQEHIDPQVVRPQKLDKQRYMELKMREQREQEGQPAKKQGDYDDLWALDEMKLALKSGMAALQEMPERRFPPEPEKDIVWFIQEFSPVLEDWQRDIMSMLRDEMLYFWPQLETKIMNEGWASYWHQRIVRELDLTTDETFEYAKLNSSVVQPSRHSLNPYYLGVKIFEDIEKRWDQPSREERDTYGRQPGQGRAKIFEVRELDSDLSFIRNYLTKQLTDELDLYIFEKKGPEWKITDKSWENIRDQLVYSRVNGGFPYLVVQDGDYQRNGELYLNHQYEGMELDLKYLERTLPYVYTMWGKPVHLETKVEEKTVMFTYDGKKVSRKFVG
ncbi:SpoVR family protein [Paenibacillus apiarius]|uniref:SpoVR family protein n=1 Tax=Paenibacillus apiarius TaxID=46240 RepID=A0ABT4E540_9BACL|nr:SpoVR family protein [Paenibacillus apiarius]MCY9514950.1 SpoVR family protein [Paenibacillus apiarius]MCY9523366.1 SpoVR family protein [Paenibacillus apiarius]MCY9554194.1 SpoVR family protein [Paenibacillus apiarius]MCY9559396.1 SpoVR family protein [Paenibacillus apiarius]MCY9686821.1 SpoVR family protein [Paenibacillus apiarius]